MARDGFRIRKDTHRVVEKDSDGSSRDVGDAEDAADAARRINDLEKMEPKIPGRTYHIERRGGGKK